MELINGRYKIKRIVNESSYNESYIVNDLWGDGNQKFLTLYLPRKHKYIIKYFVNNFIRLKSVNHDNILNCQNFNIIETINLKKNDILMYYMISEYSESMSLHKIVDRLSFKTRLIILLDLIKTINYLHYRGINYKVLNPLNVFLNRDHKVEIRDLASAQCIYIQSVFSDLEEMFIDPRIIIDPDKTNKNVDLYSLGIMIKYLFFDEYSKMLKNSNYSEQSFKDDLNKEDKKILINIVYDLTENNKSKDINLMEYIEKIVNHFQLDYKLNFVSERNHIFYKNQIRGRKVEIEEIIDMDNSFDMGLNQKKLIIVKGKNGVGKSRFLREIGFVFRIRGKKVCRLNIDGEDHLGVVSINKLLRETVRFASNEILDKYRDDFHFNSNVYDPSLEYKNYGNEEFKLYNRLKNYLSELSIDDKIYIIIDNLDKSNEKFVSIIDYLVSNLDNKNIVFIASISNEDLIENGFIINKIKDYLKNEKSYLLELHDIEKIEFNKVIKDVLGTSNLEESILIELYNRTNGNIKAAMGLIKRLYNRCGLFINELGQWEIKKENFAKSYKISSCNNDLKLQFDKISKKSFEVFKVMSTFNNIFEKETIARILNFSKAEIDKSMKELTKEDIIGRNTDDVKSSYTITNIQVKELMYAQIDKDEKEKLHKKAYNILYELYLRNNSLYLEELLNHLFNSNQNDLALKTILDYLKKQNNKYSEEYIYLLELAEETVRIIDSKEKFWILESLIEIHFSKGNIDSTKHYLERLIKISNENNNIKSLIKAKYYKADLYLNYNQLDEAKEIVEKIEKLASKIDNEDEYLRLSIVKIKYNLACNRIDLIEQELKYAMSLCKKSNNSYCRGVIYNLKGVYEYIIDNPKIALEDFINSINYLEEIENNIKILKPINNIGNILINWYGDCERAMEYFNRGYAIANRYGVKSELATFVNNIGEVHLCKFEYKKAIKYFEDSLKLLEELKELKGVFISKSNLGIAYLQIGENDKAFKIYGELENIFNEKDVYDSEILIVYYKFLSIFHGNFGNWEKAIEYSKSEITISKGNNYKDYLIAKFNKIYYEYCLHDYLNKENIELLIHEYDNTNFIYDKLKSILIFSILAAVKGDNAFSIELFLKYRSENKKMKVLLFDFFAKYTKVALNPNKENIDSLEKSLDSNSKDLYTVSLQGHIILGYKFFELKRYRKAINHFLESLNLIFKFINSIPDNNLKFKYIKRYNGDLIKEYLYRSIKLQFNKSIEYRRLEDIRDFEFDNYFKFNNIFNNLSDNEFNDLVNVNDEKENIKTLESLLSEMSGDYILNLKTILKYIKKETLAKRGFIIIQDFKNREYQDVVSIVEDDKYNKKSGILNLSNNSTMGILLNKTFVNMKESKYIEYLSDDLVGLICVSISNPIEKSNLQNRRKYDNFLNEDYRIYVYLETNSFFNRFDFERLKLLNSLSYLIYVNIQNNKLKLSNTTDKLTKVLTRKQFEKQLEDLLNKFNKFNYSFTLLMIDIDDFKDINDTYGHIKGDEVLSVIGESLKSSIRSSDLVGRYGGEEFIVALLNTDIKNGKKVAEKIRSSIEKIRIQGIDKNITVSIGVSQYPLHSQFEKVLISKADQALYQAKKTLDKNKVVVWSSEIDNTIRKDNRLEGILFGNSNLEHRNMTAIVNMVNLNTKKESFKYKAYKFLDTLNNCLDSIDATLFIVGKKSKYKKSSYKSNRSLDNNLNNIYNYSIIDRVIKNKSGEFLIDWENNYNIDQISGMPNWESIMIVPLIIREKVEAVVYLRALLKEKEFDISSLNLCKLLSDAFAPNLEKYKEEKI